MRINMVVSEDEGDGNGVAYVTLPSHPGARAGIVKQTKRLLDLIEGGYSGPDVYFDFDESNTLIGIEILE